MIVNFQTTVSYVQKWRCLLGYWMYQHAYICKWVVYSGLYNLFTQRSYPKQDKLLISYIHVWLTVVRKFEEWNVKCHWIILTCIQKVPEKNCPIKILYFVVATYISAKLVNNDVSCLLPHIRNHNYVYSTFIIMYCYSWKVLKCEDFY